jgi:dipeptidyl aminopeptidase/acylaminoacyl peptidase
VTDHGSVSPYGTWKSPISSDLLAGGGISLDALQVDGDALLWIEGRPLEGGRNVVCRAEPGADPVDLTPARDASDVRTSDVRTSEVHPSEVHPSEVRSSEVHPSEDRHSEDRHSEVHPSEVRTSEVHSSEVRTFDVRTKVNEYGGGAYAVHHGTLFFSNHADQRLWRQDPGERPTPITPEPDRPGALRYADARITPDGALLVCVRETHDHAGRVTNELVALPTDGSAAPWVLATGRDFYASPRLSPDAGRLAWLEWDHPRMPWDGTELQVADFSGGVVVSEPRLVAGGPEESVFQPEWSPGGALHFVSDRTGWWNLYREEPPGAAGEREVRALAPMEAEFGAPQWVFGLATYAFLPGGRVACLYGRGPVHHLGVLEPGSDRPTPVDLPYTSFYPPQLRALGDRVAAIAGSSTLSPAVVVIDPASGQVETLRRSRDVDLDPGHLSVARPVEFPTEGGVTAHALYYPPTNADARGPDGERPPLLVMSHGGPTAGVVDMLRLGVQFFTSRGIAVVDVDYGGSTGYGRAYRERLHGGWGVVDVDDCVNAARHLVEAGEVDGRRLAITGGSAGGYTTLCALAFRDAFAAGSSWFGVADLETFVHDTHNFESRYLDWLVGPWPGRARRYRQRSPVHAADRIDCPVLLVQGLEDAVVPPTQAEAMVRALDARGIPHAYLAFEGEQHGFRKAENIKRAFEAELWFYGRVFGFEPADPVEPVPIRHL